jgi:photosystem II stability/assembly factor-like uncharacterized protein
VLYAGFWQVRRNPWHFDSGGPGSGLWKSTDGGDTWTDISRAPGLPHGVLGRIGVTISPANPERVWAIVEAADGGVFRSDNGGRNWTKINDQNILRQRAWYYSHIFADPKSADTLYALNVGMFRSIDGGKTFTSISTPHGDNHALWIAPDNPERMIQGNDGGAIVSNDAGHTWSSVMNQPTAQFYRVALDNDFPYNIYGAQQDNSTVRTASRTAGFGITERDWYDVGGGESGWIAPDPLDSNIVYSGSYDGLITRQDHRTGQLRNITAWPDNPMGYGAEGMKYRFQWNFPMAFSPHDPKTLYIGGNVVMKTTNEGQSWDIISKDLTRNDKSKLGTSGGPITQDNTSIEYYCTIFTLIESPVKKGVIWTGSDDGLVQLTQDGGKTWVNVTPKDIPEWIQINSIDASPHDAGTAYVAATMYKSDDFQPYLYKTTDYGKSWTKIVNGIPANAFTRVIREDPNHKGLLIAGTEFGLFISYDDGANWKSFQLNLPVTSITDLAFHKRERDLVVATQGRAFYVLDDVPLLYQLSDSVSSEDAHLFKPKDSYRFGAGGRGGGGGGRGGAIAGENPPGGVAVNYWLKDRPQGEVILEFVDASGKQIRKYSSREAPHPAPTPGSDEEEGFRPPPEPRLTAQQGMNRFVWNLRYPDATTLPGMILWAGNVTGPRVAPGAYQVRLTVDGKSQQQSFEVRKDPRLQTTQEEFSKQVTLALQVRDKLSETNEGVIKIREIRKQLEPFAGREDKRVASAAQDLIKKLTAVEEELYQTKNRASEDPLNYPIKLNNKLAALLSVVTSSDNQPTSQSNMVYEDLATRANAQLRAMNALLTTDLAAFNKLVHDANAPAVMAPVKAGSGGN